LSAYNITSTSTTTNIYFTNATVTTVITISNASPYIPGSITYVTNAFSEPISFSGFVSNDFSTNLTETVETGNTYVFSLQNLVTNAVSQIIFEWVPLTAGPVTNAIGLGISVATNTASTNLVINQVYTGNANLEISNYFISQAYITNEWAITNDWVTYGITVSNLGPQSAIGVVLTNQLPLGVRLVSASKAYTTVGSNLVFTLGTLTNLGYATFQLTVAPTNTGAFTLADVVDSPGTYDANSSNDVALAELYVTNYLNDSTLVAVTNSGQIVNPQNGLIEQMIQIQNTGANPVQAVRLVVASLTNQLYNASGTNSALYNTTGTNGAQPFVVYPVSLASGASVGLRLQYSPRLPFHFTNGQLHVYEVPTTVLNYTPPPVASFYTYATNNPDFYRILPVKNDFGSTDMLLEFLNVNSNASYTIVYSTNADFSNPMIAPPAVSSSANRIQWLDYGPPATISAPANGSRYYRVIMKP
jgi:uncharacterized repeat protein (TIGR01451 family)